MLLEHFFNPHSKMYFSDKERDAIHDHGLEGWILTKDRIELAPDLKKFCQQESIKYVLRYEIFNRELKKFLQQFPQAIPLKGMSLIPRIYVNPILRRVTDIDLYLAQDLAPVRLYLSQQGFTIHGEKWEANDFKVNASKVIDEVEVTFEIHQELLWKNDCEWKIIDSNLGKSLAAEDELLYLTGHLAYQHTFLRFNWLFDIALLIQQKPDWDNTRLDFLLQQLSLNNSFSSCLWACQHFLHIKLPESLQKYVLSDKKNLLIQRTITDDFLLKVSDYPARYYLLKHLLKDSLTQAISYDLLWLKQKMKYEFKSKEN